MAALFTFAKCSQCLSELFQDDNPPEQRYAWLGSCAHRLCHSCRQDAAPCPVCGMRSSFKRSHFNSASHVVEMMASVLCELTKTTNNAIPPAFASIPTVPPPVDDLFFFPTVTSFQQAPPPRTAPILPTHPHGAPQTSRQTFPPPSQRQYAAPAQDNYSYSAQGPYFEDTRSNGQFEITRREKIENLQRYETAPYTAPKKSSAPPPPLGAKKTAAGTAKAKAGAATAKREPKERKVGTEGEKPRGKRSAHMVLQREPGLLGYAPSEHQQPQHVMIHSPTPTRPVTNKANQAFFESLRAQFNE